MAGVWALHVVTEPLNSRFQIPGSWLVHSCVTWTSDINSFIPLSLVFFEYFFFFFLVTPYQVLLCASEKASKRIFFPGCPNQLACYFWSFMNISLIRFVTQWWTLLLKTFSSSKLPTEKTPNSSAWQFCLAKTYLVLFQLFLFYKNQLLQSKGMACPHTCHMHLTYNWWPTNFGLLYCSPDHPFA